MRKFLWALLILVLGGLPGCSRENASLPGVGPVTGDRPRVALIMKSLANEFFKTMADGAETHHSGHASEYDLIVNGIKDERDLTRQVGLVEEMIGQQVDAIVIAPADSKALVSVCKRALDAGIVVVNIDNKLDAAVLEEAGAVIPFVGPDNRAGARQVGEYLARHLKVNDEVAILEGIPTAFNAQQRRIGFEDAMRAAGIHVVSIQNAQWEMDLANKITSSILAEHAELRAILCGNDSMALGALAAVKARGLAGKTAIVGFDNISAMQAALKEGSVLATADQHADRLAVFGIEYALEILNGGAPADKQTPVDLVTAESLE